MNRIKILQEQRGAKLKEARAIIDAAGTRALTADEQAKFASIEKEIEGIDASLDAENRQLAREARSAQFRPSEQSAGERRDIARFSLTRALRIMSEGRQLDGIEGEMAQEGEHERTACGITGGSGIMISARAFQRRDMTAAGTTSATGDQGGMTVQTTPIGLLDSLFARNVIAAAGATVLTGLVGNVDLPRIVAGTTPVKKGEVAQGVEYTATTTKLALQPRRVPSVIEVSNQLLRQSNVSGIDGFFQRHLEAQLRSVMEVGFIHGGGSDEPTGILGTTGIGAIYAGGGASDSTSANGAALTWADVINLEKKVAVADADLGNLYYLTNATQIGKAKQTVRVSSTDSVFIIDDRAGRTLNGYRYLVTNACSAALTKGSSGATLSPWIFGNFLDFVIAQWSGIEFLVNPYSKDDYGLTRINAAVYYDGGVIRPASFAAGDDFTA